MKIYLSGKITGDDNYRAKFAKVQKCFEQQGEVEEIKLYKIDRQNQRMLEKNEKKA